MNLLKRIRNFGQKFTGRELPVSNSMASGGSWLSKIFGQGGSQIDWVAEAKPFINNPIIAGCCGRHQSMVSESTMVIQEWDAKANAWKNTNNVFSMQLEQLKRSPSPDEHIGWGSIESHLVLGYSVFAEVYLWLRKNAKGQVIGFTIIPNEAIEPRNDKYNDGNTRFITYYQYNISNGETKELMPEDVLYIPRGVNPSDPKRGFSPVFQGAREVVLYNDASTRQGALMRNPASGNVFFPTVKENMVAPTPDQVQEGQALLQSMIYDRAGSSVALPFEVGHISVGLTPKDLDVTPIRQAAIDVICPLMGGDPMAFGFPSQSKTYANVGEALDALGKRFVLPMLAEFSNAFSRVLIPSFGLDPQRFRIWWDTSQVTWLLDETIQQQSHDRENYKVGGMDVATFKSKIGVRPAKGDEGQTYFTISTKMPTIDPKTTKANSQSNHVDGCDCGNCADVSDLAKNMVANDRATRIRVGRMLENAINTGRALLNEMPPKLIPNTSQEKHDQRIEQSRRRLLKLVERLQAKSITPDEFRELYSAEIESLHSDLYALGIKHGGGSASAEEIAIVGQQMRDLENYFIIGLADDLENERYVDAEGNPTITPALNQRVWLYSAKGSASANRGFLSGSDDNYEWYWDLNNAVEDHCVDCPYLAENSPYLKNTLYALPRDGSTPCLGECKCRIIRSDGLTGFGPL